MKRKCALYKRINSNVLWKCLTISKKHTYIILYNISNWSRKEHWFSWLFFPGRWLMIIGRCGGKKCRELSKCLPFHFCFVNRRFFIYFIRLTGGGHMNLFLCCCDSHPESAWKIALYFFPVSMKVFFLSLLGETWQSITDDCGCLSIEVHTFVPTLI